MSQADRMTAEEVCPLAPPHPRPQGPLWSPSMALGALGAQEGEVPQPPEAAALGRVGRPVSRKGDTRPGPNPCSAGSPPNFLPPKHRNKKEPGVQFL